jgi:hypothetical protein
MDEFGESLLQGETANGITALISLQRLAETIGAFHRSKDVPMNDPVAAEVNAHMFQNELQAWRTTVPNEVRSLRTFSLITTYEPS